jgi:hypothetical protein
MVVDDLNIEDLPCLMTLKRLALPDDAEKTCLALPSVSDGETCTEKEMTIHTHM